MSSTTGKQLPTSWRWPSEELRRRFNSKIAADGLKGQRWFEDTVTAFLEDKCPRCLGHADLTDGVNHIGCPICNPEYSRVPFREIMLKGDSDGSGDDKEA